MARPPTRSFPDRKISETLLDFAAPLLPERPGETTEAQVRHALLVSCTVWNAVIFADVLGNPRFLDELRRRLSPALARVGLLDEMIARKRTRFAADKRLVGDWKLRQENGEVRLWVEARDPDSVPPHAAGEEIRA